jgi:hypothetical protein
MEVRGDATDLLFGPAAIPAADLGRCCSSSLRARPLTQLSTDLSTGNMPQFVWITPNNCNNMHGGASGCPFPNAPNDANQQAPYQDGEATISCAPG